MKSYNPGKIMIRSLDGEEISIDTPEMTATIDCMSPDEIAPIQFNSNFEFAADMDMDMDSSTRSLLLGNGNNYMPPSEISYSIPYETQARKHKQKRINKKWLKRYGYVTLYRQEKFTLDSWTLVPNEEDGTIEFEARCRR